MTALQSEVLAELDGGASRSNKHESGGRERAGDRSFFAVGVVEIDRWAPAATTELRGNTHASFPSATLGSVWAVKRKSDDSLPGY